MSNQVSKVLIFDNESDNRDEVSLLDGTGNCTVFLNGGNIGLPISLNEGCSKALGMRARYALLLDQDSVVSEGMVASLAECISEDIGIVSPQIVDRNKNEGFVPSNSIVPVKRVITSGALVRLDVCRETC